MKEKEEGGVENEGSEGKPSLLPLSTAIAISGVSGIAS
jgi:hypothetical protein